MRLTTAAILLTVILTSPACTMSLARGLKDGDAGRVEKALARGANPNRPMNSLRWNVYIDPISPLQYATSSDHGLTTKKRLVEFLLKSGADPNLRGRGQHCSNPLGNALRAGDDEIVMMLLRANADPKGWDCGHMADLLIIGSLSYIHGDIEKETLLEMLRLGAPPNGDHWEEENKDKLSLDDTPLTAMLREAAKVRTSESTHRAAELVMLLINNGADPNFCWKGVPKRNSREVACPLDLAAFNLAVASVVYEAGGQSICSRVECLGSARTGLAKGNDAALRRFAECGLAYLGEEACSEMLVKELGVAASSVTCGAIGQAATGEIDIGTLAIGAAASVAADSESKLVRGLAGATKLALFMSCVSGE